MKIVRSATQKEIDMIWNLVNMGLEVNILGGRSPLGDRHKYRGTVDKIELRKGEVWITLDPIINQPRLLDGYSKRSSRIWQMPRVRADRDDEGWFLEIR
jgi:hypothetical protein